MKFEPWINLTIVGIFGLLAYIAYTLSNLPHYQIAGAGEVIWKIDTQTGALQRCHPKIVNIPTGGSYVDITCDP